MRVLDLFCGAGGAGEGYRRAGFEVTGVDINPQPRYKPGAFVQADALAYAREHGAVFDLIHASPPCQAYSVASAVAKANGATYPDMVAETRAVLMASGKAWVIENVPSAPLINPVILEGTMFDLLVIRRRLFEMSHPILLTPMPYRARKAAKLGRRPDRDKDYISVSGNFSDVAFAREAMGIDWMTRDELAQAIPPAYTEYLGRWLWDVLNRQRVRTDAVAHLP